MSRRFLRDRPPLPNAQWAVDLGRQQHFGLRTIANYAAIVPRSPFTGVFPTCRDDRPVVYDGYKIIRVGPPQSPLRGLLAVLASAFLLKPNAEKPRERG
jgi:hypothetical protein